MVGVVSLSNHMGPLKTHRLRAQFAQSSRTICAEFALSSRTIRAEFAQKSRTIRAELAHKQRKPNDKKSNAKEMNPG